MVTVKFRPVRIDENPAMKMPMPVSITFELDFTRLTTRGRSHTLPRGVASEAEYERLQARCSCDFQLLAATQV